MSLQPSNSLFYLSESGHVLFQGEMPNSAVYGLRINFQDQNQCSHSWPGVILVHQLVLFYLGLCAALIIFHIWYQPFWAVGLFDLFGLSHVGLEMYSNDTGGLGSPYHMKHPPPPPSICHPV